MEQIYKFAISNKADKDLAKLYLNEYNIKKISENILIRYENIRQMPHMYQRLYYNNKTKTDYRRTVLNKYIIIYKIFENQITILRIISQRKNYLKSKFLKSL